MLDKPFPADGDGGLRAQADAVTAAVVEGVHLLGDDVGRLPQGAGEHAAVLEDGGGPLVETVGRGDAAGGDHHVGVAALVLADQVVGAAGGLEFACHGLSVVHARMGRLVIVGFMPAREGIPEIVWRSLASTVAVEEAALCGVGAKLRHQSISLEPGL